MKRKLILTLSLLVIVAVGFKTGLVLSQSNADLPRVETACEGKGGVLLAKDGDGYGLIRKCPKGMRLVALGSVAENGVSTETENIAFLSGSSILKKNGEVWFYDTMDGKWSQSEEGTITEVSIDNIVQWNESAFITKDGHFWVSAGEDGSWVDVGSPE